MVFIAICSAGFVFVVLAFAGAFNRRPARSGRSRFRRISPLIDRTQSEVIWKNEPKNVLARDQMEFLSMLERHNSDPNNFPMPVPPPSETSH